MFSVHLRFIVIEASLRLLGSEKSAHSIDNMPESRIEPGKAQTRRAGPPKMTNLKESGLRAFERIRSAEALIP